MALYGYSTPGAVDGRSRTDPTTEGDLSPIKQARREHFKSLVMEILLAMKGGLILCSLEVEFLGGAILTSLRHQYESRSVRAFCSLSGRRASL